MIWDWGVIDNTEGLAALLRDFNRLKNWVVKSHEAPEGEMQSPMPKELQPSYTGKLWGLLS